MRRFPMTVLDFVLMLLIVFAVVVGIQSVGMVLMAAILITPAAAARFWTERLGLMLVLAGACGALSGVVGTMVSTLGARLPTGPLIVLTATAVLLVSLVAAPLPQSRNRRDSRRKQSKLRAESPPRQPARRGGRAATARIRRTTS